ncbi:MAG: site-specific integrase [Parolsenella sp.]|uniref:tyrosine-type recombinase/integrase n=1 Tax=Parolsenella sp. TaxID=2083006 RepID=UPI002A75DBE2|nr:site-specific integrase [Parolsenella sp.]MCI5950102.1 site-specific integrase [Coriobacteriaceae bacterium]MDY3292527.1 site-specific integrase [Parolsenella sp.]
MSIRPRVIGNGSVYQVKEGVFQYRFNLGKDPKTGKYAYSPKRTLHCEGMSKRTQQAMLRKALEDYKEELNSGIVREDGDRTVSEYAEDFHNLRAESFKSPLAYAREENYIRHIQDMFGHMRLSDLKPDDVRHIYAAARKSGMSEAELHGTHVKLRQILQDAVDNELILRNPCTPVKLPKPTYRERAPLTAEEASRFLSCLMDEPLSAKAAGTMLLLQCGLRRGEMLGLTWGDIDFKQRTLSVSRQFTNDKTLRAPKSKMSRRTIAINDSLANYLTRWKSEQLVQLSQYTLSQGEETPVVNGIRVVTTGDGKYATVVNVDGHNFDRWFRDFCVDNGFGKYENVSRTFARNGKKHTRGTHYSGLVPHALRHTQATLLIGEGADVKTVQARLGHASPSTTLSIYSHAIEANDRKAADAFGELISG